MVERKVAEIEHGGRLETWCRPDEAYWKPYTRVRYTDGTLETIRWAGWADDPRDAGEIARQHYLAGDHIIR